MLMPLLYNNSIGRFSGDRSISFSTPSFLIYLAVEGSLESRLLPPHSFPVRYLCLTLGHLLVSHFSFSVSTPLPFPPSPSLSSRAFIWSFWSLALLASFTPLPYYVREMTCIKNPILKPKPHPPLSVFRGGNIANDMVVFIEVRIFWCLNALYGALIWSCCSTAVRLGTLRVIGVIELGLEVRERIFWCARFRARVHVVTGMCTGCWTEIMGWFTLGGFDCDTRRDACLREGVHLKLQGDTE